MNDIWMLNQYAVPSSVAGGTRHFDLSKELVRKGYRTTIFASGWDYAAGEDTQLDQSEVYKEENIQGVKFVWLRTLPYGENNWRRVLNMLSFAFRSVRVGAKLSTTPDVIVGSSVHLFAGLAGYMLARKKKARFIFEIRDLWPQVLIDTGNYSKRGIGIRLMKLLERFLYQKAEKIISVLPEAARYITKLGIPGDKIVYIPNGVNLDPFVDVDTHLPQDLETGLALLRSQKKFLVGYTGAHSLSNNVGTLLKAARIIHEKGLDEIHFLLVGTGTEKAALTNLASEWGLTNVGFMDPLAKRFIPSFLGQLDAAVMIFKRSNVYKYGVSPNKLFAYMAAAMPVVFAVESPNDPVSESLCGLSVAPENPESLAEAIIRLSRMPKEEREAMGHRGRDYVEKYHSIPVLAERLIQCIEEVSGR
jgi:glycosyltransferase involved in cell wall biosynthesis